MLLIHPGCMTQLATVQAFADREGLRNQLEDTLTGLHLFGCIFGSNTDLGATRCVLVLEIFAHSPYEHGFYMYRRQRRWWRPTYEFWFNGRIVYLDAPREKRGWHPMPYPEGCFMGLPPETARGLRPQFAEALREAVVPYYR